MYSKLTVFIACVFLILFFSLADAATVKEINSIDICFSPNGNCTDAIVTELDAAKMEILVQAYSFTSAPIAAALVRAHKCGVTVNVIMDKSQDREGYSSVTFLRNAGITTVIDSAHAIAHNKVMIIDAETMITGSFNFTAAAEKKTLKTS